MVTISQIRRLQQRLAMISRRFKRIQRELAEVIEEEKTVRQQYNSLVKDYVKDKCK